ncbi:hypothetical protein EYF80_049956 [Liparis tanakae]|uniref:Uncharacterized protein n=1 Tax=Liparis tanakae TaxID=230148 RepID=A0A4Z2FGL3_9TELE|nr:hypothetical protein EYF80_049956 [Liparis tanakae]
MRVVLCSACLARREWSCCTSTSLSVRTSTSSGVSRSCMSTSSAATHDSASSSGGTAAFASEYFLFRPSAMPCSKAFWGFPSFENKYLLQKYSMRKFSDKRSPLAWRPTSSSCVLLLCSISDRTPSAASSHTWTSCSSLCSCSLSSCSPRASARPSLLLCFTLQETNKTQLTSEAALRLIGQQRLLGNGHCSLPVVATLHGLQPLTERGGWRPLQVGGDSQQPGGTQLQRRQGAVLAVQPVLILVPGLQQVVQVLGGGGLRPGSVGKLRLHVVQEGGGLLHLRGGAVLTLSLTTMVI